MTAPAPIVQGWINAIEQDVGTALARAARPSALMLETAPYVATFTRQARDWSARAVDAQARGDRVEAKTWARHAQRALSNLTKLNRGIAGRV